MLFLDKLQSNLFFAFLLYTLGSSITMANTDRSNESGIHKAVIQVGNLRRSYSYYVPNKTFIAPAMVIVFHGSGGDGQRARRATGYNFEKLANQNGFLVVYPDGFEHHWNGCRRAGPYSANKLDIDDVGFIDALINRFSEEYRINPHRVYAMGMSNGGHMSYRLALELPHRITAIAATIASLPGNDNLDCTPRNEPVSVMIVNGTNDPINPYAGGRVNLFGSGDRGTVISTVETFEYWRKIAGHSGLLSTYTYPDSNPNDKSWVERTTARSPGRSEVTLFTVHGGGHTLPHPYIHWPKILGTNNRDINIIEEIWGFFDRQNNEG